MGGLCGTKGEEGACLWVAFVFDKEDCKAWIEESGHDQAYEQLQWPRQFRQCK